MARLAEADQLEDVDLKNGVVKIQPLAAITPDAAKTRKARVDALVPRIRITDLLIEVDAWTRFSALLHAPAQRPGVREQDRVAHSHPCRWRQSRPHPHGRCLRGASLPQLAWAHDWHIRDETYSAALAGLSIPNARFHSRKFGARGKPRHQTVSIFRPAAMARRSQM